MSSVLSKDTLFASNIDMSANSGVLTEKELLDVNSPVPRRLETRLFKPLPSKVPAPIPNSYAPAVRGGYAVGLPRQALNPDDGQIQSMPRYQGVEPLRPPIDNSSYNGGSRGWQKQVPYESVGLNWEDDNEQGILTGYHSEEEMIQEDEKDIIYPQVMVPKSQRTLGSLGQIPFVTSLIPSSLLKPVIDIFLAVKRPELMTLGFPSSSLDRIEILVAKIKSGEDLALAEMAEMYGFYKMYQTLKKSYPDAPVPAVPQLTIPALEKELNEGIPTWKILGGITVVGLLIYLVAK